MWMLYLSNLRVIQTLQLAQILAIKTIGVDNIVTQDKEIYSIGLS
jgi:hypothetical protein